MISSYQSGWAARRPAVTAEGARGRSQWGDKGRSPSWSRRSQVGDSPGAFVQQQRRRGFATREGVEVEESRQGTRHEAVNVKNRAGGPAEGASSSDGSDAESG